MYICEFTVFFLKSVDFNEKFWIRKRSLNIQAEAKQRDVREQ